MAGIKRFGERLDAGMIGDRDCLHSPFFCLFDVIRNRVGGIHRAHRSMQMQFNPFLAFCSIFSGGMTDLLDGIGHDRQITHVGIFLNRTACLDPLAFFDCRKLGLVFFVVGELLNGKR